MCGILGYCGPNVDRFKIGVDYNLNYTYKARMAFGIEVRVPFLNKESVEFSTSIPTALKMKYSKTILDYKLDK